MYVSLKTQALHPSSQLTAKVSNNQDNLSSSDSENPDQQPLKKGVGSLRPSEQSLPCTNEMSTCGLTPYPNSLNFSLGMLSMWVPNLSFSTSFKGCRDWPIFKARSFKLHTGFIGILYTISSWQRFLSQAFLYMLTHVSCGLRITHTDVSAHLMPATNGWAVWHFHLLIYSIFGTVRYIIPLLYMQQWCLSFILSE